MTARNPTCSTPVLTVLGSMLAATGLGRQVRRTTTRRTQGPASFALMLVLEWTDRAPQECPGLIQHPTQPTAVKSSLDKRQGRATKGSQKALGAWPVIVDAVIKLVIDWEREKKK